MKRSAFTMSIVLFAAATICRAFPSQDESPQQLMDAGRRCYDSGDYEAAAVKFRAAVEADPSLLIGWENLAWSYRRLKRFEEAAEICRNLLKVKPGAVRYLNLLAGTLLDAEQPAKAEEVYRQSLAIEPDQAVLQLGLARSLVAMSRFEEALAHAEKAISGQPKELDGYVLAADIHLALHQPDNAIRVLTPLLEDHSEEITLRRLLFRAFNEKGAVLFQQQKYDEAVQAFQASLRYDPDSMRAKMNLAWALDRLERNDEALGIWIALTEEHPQDSRLWNHLAQLHSKMGHLPESAAAYEESLRIEQDQPDIRLTLAKVRGWNRDYDKAIEQLLSLRDEHPENIQVDRYLGTFLFEARRYEEAIPYLERYLARAPHDETTAFRAASSLYACEDYDSAIAMFHALYRDDPANVLSRLALADAAASQHRYEESLVYLQEILAQNPRHLGAFNKLVAYASQANRYDIVVQAASAFLKADPEDPYPLLPLADAERLLGRDEEAAANYLRVLDMNPSCLRAMAGLSEATIGMQQYEQARRLAEKMIEQIPADLSLRFRFSRVLSAGGDFQGAVEALRPLTDETNALSIPILLYHGLTKRERDPALHLERFRSQMEALTEAGYVTIDTFELKDILKGRLSPPQKPIVITFDDAMHDSLELADPILKDLGMKAVISVPVAQVNSRHPVFASWEELETYRKTGRWDVQAHGDESHIEIPVHPGGRTSRFMVNRKWLEEENRLETPEEFHRRLTEDHQSCIQRIEAHVSTEVHAYAVPLGDYGQETPTNYGEAAAANLELIRKFYDLSFFQGPDGFNPLSADPHLLARLNVPLDWDRQALLRHLRLNNPRPKALLWIARNHSWAGEFEEALRTFARAREAGADEFSVLLSESLTYKWMGAFQKAQTLAQKAKRIQGDDPDLEKHIADLRRRTRPSWSSSFEFFADGENRSRYSVGQMLSAYLRADLEGMIGIQRFWLEEDIRPDVDGLLSSASIRKQWSYPRELKASLLWYHLQGRSDEWGYEFGYWTPTGDADTIRFFSTRTLSDSVRAVEADIQVLVNVLDWRHNFGERFATRTLVDRRDYSDGNYRWTLRGGPEWLWRKTPNLTLAAEIAFSDANRDVPEYYTPQELVSGRLVARLRGKTSSSLDYSLNVSAGYGTDEVEGGKFTGSAGGGIRYTVSDRTRITLDAFYSRSPSYEWGTAQAGLQIAF